MTTQPDNAFILGFAVAALLAAPASALAAAPTAQQQQATGQFQPGTEKTAVYDTPRGELTVHSGMPVPKDYGPAPSFATLDSNGDHHISQQEAKAYPPLANDFLYVSGDQTKPISKSQYQRWVATK